MAVKGIGCSARKKIKKCDLTDAEVLQETKMIKAYKEEKVKQGKLKDAVIMSSKIGLADRPKL